jgi:uncharacterized protein
MLRLTSTSEKARALQSVPFRFSPEDFTPRLKTRLLILQPTPFCNIDCSYCYLPNRSSKARMSLATVHQAALRIQQDGLAGNELTVVWHAGEPLTMPRSFYEDAFAAIREALDPAVSISHSIQTNATLIDDAWCDLFIRHDVRIGVSVDGPAHLHDLHRKTRNGRGTHALVKRGMEQLRAHSIAFHAIAVVTEPTLAAADDFVEFFLESGVEELGCNFDEAEGAHERSTLVGCEQSHSAFLEHLLHRSVSSGGRLRVRELANAYRAIAQDFPVYQWNGRAWPDDSQVVPFAIVTVACNGDFSTFSPELSGQTSEEFEDFVVGNVHRCSYLEGASSETFSRLWNAIAHGVLACEKRCPYFRFCGGGAPANKLSENQDVSSTETLYCRTMIQRPLETVLRHLERTLASANTSRARLETCR